MAKLGRFLFAIVALPLFAAPAEAGLIEQIDCVYDAVPQSVRQELAIAYVTREAPDEDGTAAKSKAKTKEAADVARKTCTKEHDWTESDGENAVRYMLFHTLADDMAAKIAPESKAIADRYFNENVGSLINQDDFMSSDIWPIRSNFHALGLEGEEAENAITYLAWTIITQQMRGDFATGKTRGR